VYLGTDDTGTQVAIKWLRPEMSGDPVMVERFVREVAVAERVSPFCTAQVLGTGIENDRPYIISEYIEGPSLQAVVTDSGPRTGPSLHRLAIGTSTALAAIHQAGIVHRDFKPANVLLASDGPRVIDFGIARALDATSTISSMPVGTPAYMAPEQILGHTVGPSADLFSWASTMLYASSGKAPFGSDTLPAVINRVLNTEPDLSSLQGSLRDLVAACLSKDPARRPTAEQVILRLLQHPVSSPAILKEAAEAASEQPGHAKAMPDPQSFPGAHGRPSPGAAQPSPWGPAGTTPPQAPAQYGTQSQQQSGQYAQPGAPYGQQQQHYQAPAPYEAQPAAPPGGYPPQQGTPTPSQRGGSRRGTLIASMVGGTLVVLLAVTLVVVLNNRSGTGDPDPTGTVAGPTASATPTSTPAPTPTPATVPTRDLKRTRLPGSKVTLVEHQSDPITLTSYQIQNPETDEWEDYARASLTGGFAKYEDNWESKVSPNGRYLASRGKSYTSDDYDSVVITDRDDGSRTTIKTVEKPLIASVWLWSKDSSRVLLAIERKRGDDMITQGFVVATVGQTFADVVKISDTSVRESYYGWAGSTASTVTVSGQGEDRTLHFYDLNGTVQRTIPAVGTVPDTMDFFSPSGERFVTDCPGGTSSDHCIWDAESGVETKRFSSQCDKVIGWYDETHLTCWEVDGAVHAVQVIDFTGRSVRNLVETTDSARFTPAFTRKPAG
jgi:serine/threonine protein kinase